MVSPFYRKTIKIVNSGSDDEGEGDSSPILTDLASMFPAIDYNELVTILRSHGEDVDATVDYLMALSLHKETEGAIHQGLMMGEESYGRFSDEIGGPPEVLPSFMTGRQTDSDSDEAEEDAPSNHRGNVGSDEEDPLPSYEEAMQEGESYIVAGSIMLPTSAGDTQGPLMRRNLVGATANQPEQPHSNKKNSMSLLSTRVNMILQYLTVYEEAIHNVYGG